jgi:hypothetical protein
LAVDVVFDTDYFSDYVGSPFMTLYSALASKKNDGTAAALLKAGKVT